MLVGESASIIKIITEEDIDNYAKVSGDFNPCHMSDEEARRYGFKGRVAHGLFTAGLISNVLGMKLPGPGTVYLDQKLKFLAPVYIGDVIEVTIRVEKLLRPEKGIYLLSTKCVNQDSVTVVDGEAVVKYTEDMK